MGDLEIVGAVLFGSRATGTATPDSDADILVVAEGIPPKRHRRVEEIFSIKRSLPGIPVDILLLTPDEVRQNFQNHNPLFLDIAEEGIVILDRNGFLEALRSETRAYVRERRIRRTPGGWDFPVADHVETFLSKVSNKDFSKAMLVDGERDYRIGLLLIEQAFFDKAVYHFQQSVEKCVKSILLSLGTFRKSHFVGATLLESLDTPRIPAEWADRLKRVAELSEKIEPEGNLARYPGISDDALWLPVDEYDRSDADRAEAAAREVLACAEEYFGWWFDS